MRIADLFVDLHLDTGGFDRELKTALAKASRNDLKIKASVDVRGANRGLSSLGRNVNKASSGINVLTGRLKLIADALLILGPAAAPITAVAVPAVAALGSVLIGAGAAATTAGLAFAGIGDALKAMQKASLEPTVGNLQDMRVALQELSPEARQFTRYLFSLGDELDRMQASAGRELFPGLQAGLEAAGDRLPQVNRLLERYGRTLGNIAEDAGEALATDRWDVLFRVIRTGRPMLDDLAHATGDVAHGLLEILDAFTPLSKDGFDWVREAAESFDDWATGLDQTEGFRDFVEYVRESGPQVLATVGAIANAIIDIGQAAAPLGGPVLRVIQALAEALSALASSPIGTALIGAAIGMRAISRVTPLVSGLSDAFVDLYTSPDRAGTAMQRFGGIAKGVAGAAGLGLLTMSLSETNEMLGGFEAVAGGALTGFMVGGPVGAGIGAVAGAMLNLAVSTSRVNAALDDLGEFAESGSLFEIGEGIEAATQASEDAEGSLGWVREGIKLIPVLGSYLSLLGAEGATSFDEAQEKAEDYIKEFEAADETITQFAEGLAGVEWDNLTGDDKRAAIREVTEQLQDMGFTVEDLASMDPKTFGRIMTELGRTEGLEEFTASAIRATRATEDFQAALTDFDNFLSGRSNLRDYEEGLDNFNKLIVDGAKNFDIGTAKGRENVAMLDTWSQSAIDAARDMPPRKGDNFLAGFYRDLKSIEGASPAAQREIDKTMRHIEKAVGPKRLRIIVESAEALEKARTFAGQVKGIPQRRIVNLLTDGVPLSVRQMNRFKNNLPKKQYNTLLKLDAEDANVDADKATEKVETFDRKDARARFGADLDPLTDNENTANRKLTNFSNQTAKATLDANADPFNSTIGSANAALSAFDSRSASSTITTNIVTNYQTTGTRPGPAGGGLIRGPGTGTSDSIPIQISNGEYVIRTAAVNKYGVGFMHRLNSMRFARGGQAGGGRDRFGTDILRDVANGLKKGFEAASITKDLRQVVRRNLKGEAEQNQLKRLDRLVNLTGKIKDANDKVARAQTKLSAAREVKSSFVEGVRGQLAPDISQFGTTRGGIRAGLSGQLAQVKTFVGNLRKLGRRGLLPSAMLAQIAQLGPTDGNNAALQLLALSDKQLRAAGGDFTALESFASQQSAALGGTYYNAGIESAKATLTKMQKDQREYNQVFETAADKFATRLAKNLHVDLTPGRRRHRNRDSGGWLDLGETLVSNNTGAKEAVLTAQQWDQMDRLIRVLERGGGGGGGAPLIGHAVIRENVDLARYERQRAFRNRSTRVGR